MANQTVRSWDPELVPTVAGRTSSPVATCPVEAALEVISGRWTTLVLRELAMGPLTYSTLSRRLPPLSEKVLSERLGKLLRLGVVERRVAAGFPDRVTYQLTESGQAFRPLLIELYRAGECLLSDRRE